MNHSDVAGLFPILNREELDVNVAGALGGATGIDHFDT
jgi:hypothetical protein